VALSLITAAILGAIETFLYIRYFTASERAEKDEARSRSRSHPGAEITFEHEGQVITFKPEKDG
jgi:hypothetical protein